MLVMHFTENRDLKEIARAFGVDQHGYRTFLRRFHAVLASIRKGLAKRGFEEMPPWHEEVSGRALDGGE